MADIASFNSRAREGRDREGHNARRRSTGFNSRAREGRDRYREWVETVEYCFNARAREGRDEAVAEVCRVLPVSIHAPARGATSRFARNQSPNRFQCTRPRGARHRRRCIQAAEDGFNSRAREGRDLGFRAVAGGINVSIHAPARGATNVRLRICVRQGCFNSRAREGRDRFSAKRNARQGAVSIHAPARGAT